MAASNLVPDLVKLSKLVTHFHSDPKYTEHITYASRNGKERRRIGKEEVWVRKRKLGRGGFGIVWLEQCIQGDKQDELRAVKEVPKHGSENYNRELEAIALFSHENYDHCFVKSFGWYEDEMDIFIAMEFLPEGDLGKYLGSPLPEQEAQDIAAQILEGLQFMHDHSFAHRDLKPDNILVACKGPDWWVKIADFGISKRAAEGATAFRTLAGTPAFAAPEVLRYIQVDGESDQSYTNTVDIWSLSVILFLVLTGESLFKTPSRLIRYVAGDISFPSDQLLANHVSENGCDFLKNAMQPRPENRPRTDECRQHVWVQRDLQATKPPRPLDMPDFPPEPPDSVDLQPSARWSTQDQMSVLNINDSKVEIDEGSRSEPSLQDQVSLMDTDVPTPVSVNEATIGSKIFAKVGPEKSIYQRRSLQIRSLQVKIKCQPHFLDFGAVPVAFSSNGEQLASGLSASNTIVVWDVATGRLLNVFAENSKRTSSNKMGALAYSPDGKLLASGSLDYKIDLWDLSTDQHLRSFTKIFHLKNLKEISFSPDGKQLASLGWDGIIDLWDPLIGTLLRSLQNPRLKDLPTKSFSYSPNSKQLVSISDGNSAIWIWDLFVTTVPERTDMSYGLAVDFSILFGTDSIAAIAYSADGRQLLSVVSDGIQIWDPATNILVKNVLWSVPLKFIMRTHPAVQAYFSPDAQEVVIQTQETIYVLDTIKGEVAQVIDGKYGTGVVFSPDGAQLALGENTQGPQGQRIKHEIHLWASKSPTNKFARTRKKFDVRVQSLLKKVDL